MRTGNDMVIPKLFDFKLCDFSFIILNWFENFAKLCRPRKNG